MQGSIYNINEIRNIITPIAQMHGVERAYLFGSYARGEATADSDIDLHIEKGKVTDLFLLAEFNDALQEKLGVKVDVLTSGALSDDFFNEIRKEEVMLYAAG
jgi:predicted nucleotidyltransferase